MSLFARDLYNMHRQMNSLFDAMHSAYGLEDIDDFMMPAYNNMQRIDNGQANTQQTLLAKDKSALTPAADQSEQRANNKTSSSVAVRGHNSNNSLSLFPSVFGQSLLSMSADIHAEPDKYLVSCELPGVDKSSIDISADKRTNTLSIKAEKRHEFTQRSDAQTNKQVFEDKSAAAQSDNNKEEQVVSHSDDNSKTSPRLIRQERSYGMVQRSFRLSKDADLENIQAKFENGVLQLNVPRLKKAEKDETKKITIQ